MTDRATGVPAPARTPSDTRPPSEEIRRLAHLARACPVTSMSPDLVMVFASQPARQMLRDPRLVVGPHPALPPLRTSRIDEVDALYRGMFSLRDGDAHTQLRQIVAPFFTRAAASGTRAEIADLVASSWPDPAPDGFDLVEDFTDRLPVWLNRRLMDLPAADEERLVRWARSLRDQLTPGTSSTPAGDRPGTAATGRSGRAEADTRVLTDLAELREYTATALATATGGPLAALAAALRDGRIGPDTATATVALLLVNGLDTLSQALVHAVLLVATDPDRLAAVRDDPDSALAAFRTALRERPPLRMLARRATCPMEIDEYPVPAGATVVVQLPAALADDGGTSAERTGALAYGHGEHICLGMHHADLVGTELIAMLARRYHRVEALPGAVAHPGPAVQGYRHLPVRAVPLPGAEGRI